MTLLCPIELDYNSERGWNIYAAFELFIKLHFHSSQIIFPSPNSVCLLCISSYNKVGFAMWEFVVCVCGGGGRYWELSMCKHQCDNVCLNYLCPLFLFLHMCSRSCLRDCVFVFSSLCIHITANKGYWSCGRWCPDARGWSSGHQLTCRSRSQSWRRWSWRGRCGRWQTLAVGSPPPSGPSASTPAPCKGRKREQFIIPCWLGGER